MKKFPLVISLSLFILLVLTGFLPKNKISGSPAGALEQAQVQSEQIIGQTPPHVTTPAPISLPVQKKAIVTKPPVSKPKAIPKLAAPSLTSCDVGTFNAQFLCLINKYRASKNLNALSYDSALNTTATAHSTWMNVTKTMSHTGENGSIFYERCEHHNTTCDAENVAMGYTTAQKLFDAWKASPGHNANMLGSHTKMGLSLVGKYAAQLFR